MRSATILTGAVVSDEHAASPRSVGEKPVVSATRASTFPVVIIWATRMEVDSACHCATSFGSCFWRLCKRPLTLQMFQPTVFYLPECRASEGAALTTWWGVRERLAAIWASTCSFTGFTVSAFWRLCCECLPTYSARLLVGSVAQQCVSLFWVTCGMLAATAYRTVYNAWICGKEFLVALRAKLLDRGIRQEYIVPRKLVIVNEFGSASR